MGVERDLGLIVGGGVWSGAGGRGFGEAAVEGGGDGGDRVGEECGGGG